MAETAWNARRGGDRVEARWIPTRASGSAFGGMDVGLDSFGTSGARQPYLPMRVESYAERRLSCGSALLVYSFRSHGLGARSWAVPDGCVDLSFGFGPDDVLVTVGGTVLGAKSWDFFGEREWVGCRFRPGEALLPKGLAPCDVVNTDLVLDCSDYGEGLVEELAALSDQQSRMDVLARALGSEPQDGSRAAQIGSDGVSRRLTSLVKAGSKSVRELERFARRRILESGGTVTVSTLADEAGVSARYLRNAFSQVHGISPKQFSRFVRFQHAMELIAQSEDSTQAQSLALACGYSDQSHLVHEFNEFAGMTPGRFRALVCGV